MKQPANTVPPLVGAPTEKGSLWGLFRPQHRRDAYYEARDRRSGLYLLWMECPRFGVRMAYPCVLEEAGAAPLVFGTGAPDEAETDAALIRRWDELDPSSHVEDLEIRTLERAEFRNKYREFLRG